MLFEQPRMGTFPRNHANVSTQEVSLQRLTSPGRGVLEEEEQEGKEEEDGERREEEEILDYIRAYHECDTLTHTAPRAAQNYRQQTDPEQQPFAESGGKSAPAKPSANEGSHTARSRYSETTWGDVWSDIKLFCANPFPFLVHPPSSFHPSSIPLTLLTHSAHPFNCHPASILPHRHQFLAPFSPLDSTPPFRIAPA